MSDSKPPSWRIRCEERIAGLKSERDSWNSHWLELAQFILPRRYRWLATSTNASRGGPINSRIIDETGTIAFRTLAAGMMSGITSPSAPWFKLSLAGWQMEEVPQPVLVWLSEVETRLMRIFSESNFYSAMATKYFDLAVFGTSAMLMYQDYDNVIHCTSPCLGEFYVGNNDRGGPETFAREFVMTAVQLKERFGEDRLSEAAKTALERRGQGLAKEFTVRHLIEPNMGCPGIARSAKWSETYWQADATDDQLLETKGYTLSPAMVGRWDLTGNDAYGRSPGMDALGAIKQLQQQQKRKAQGIDKMVNPPLMADIQLKNQPASSLPGGVTYVNNLGSNPGMKPIYQVAPDLQYLGVDIQQVQSRIKEIAFNDLFLMISQLDTVRTATEIDARREEKLTQLGPVLERFENEVLDPAVLRTYDIALRGGLLPAAPPEAQGENLQINYVSMLAEAQRATASSGLERLWQIGGQLASVDPTILDIYDFEGGLREYSKLLSVSPKALRDAAMVAQIRQQRAAQQQQAELLQQTVAGAQGAKTLSQADVGGGQNALQLMMGGGNVGGQ